MASSGGYYAPGNLGQGDNGGGWENSWGQNGLMNSLAQSNALPNASIGQGSQHPPAYSATGVTNAGVSMPLHQAYTPATMQSPHPSHQTYPMMRSSPTVSQWSTPPSVGSPLPHNQIIQHQYVPPPPPAQPRPPPPPPPAFPPSNSALLPSHPFTSFQPSVAAPSTSNSLQSFDQIFMGKAPLGTPPPPPPPPPQPDSSAAASLVPQQIRKRSPKRSRGRKRNRNKASKASAKSDRPANPKDNRTSPTPNTSTEDSIHHLTKSPSQESSSSQPEAGDAQKPQEDEDAVVHQNKRARLEKGGGSTSSPLVSVTTLDSIIEDKQESATESQIAEGIVETKGPSNDAAASEKVSSLTNGVATMPASYPTTHSTRVESSDGDSTAKPTSKSNKALELMRAKLELAKKKKLAAQDELRRKQRLANQGKIGTATSSSTSSSLPHNPRTSLLRRSESHSPDTTNGIPPITALTGDLVIVNISQTGPEDMVRFPPDDDEDSGISTGEEDSDDQADKAGESEMLAARKSKLQQDLDALRQRLEEKQKAVQQKTRLDEGTASSDNEGEEEKAAAAEDESKKMKYAAMSKEELEKRRIEVQELRDVSYWKHYVSKQQHLLAGVTEQVKENTDALEECDRELANVNRSIEKTSQIVDDLDARQNFVSDKLSENVKKLMEARRRLHELKQTEAISKPPASHLVDAEDEDASGLAGLSDDQEKVGVEETIDGSDSGSDDDSDLDQFEDAVMDIPKEPNSKQKRNETVQQQNAQEESKSKQIEAASDDKDDQFADPQLESQQMDAESDVNHDQFAEP